MKKLSLIWKKKSLLFILMTAMCVMLWSCSDDDDPVVEDEEEEQEEEEEDVQVVLSFDGRLTDAETYFQAEDGEAFGDWGYYQSSFTDNDGLANFTHFYASWGFGGGFTYTNLTDVTTPGYNNLSAITGEGVSSEIYLTASTANEVTITNLDTDTYQFVGAYITNSTYAYLAIAEGDDGNTPAYAAQFGDDDWFILTATGYTAEGEEIASLDFSLATGTDFVTTWTWFDWTSISSASYITFSMSSSDTGDYGMNTPAYFCIDGITLVDPAE